MERRRFLSFITLGPYAIRISCGLCSSCVITLGMKNVSLNTSRSTYDGPESISQFVFGSTSIKLARPADPERLLDDPEVLAWNELDDYMPYWAALWPGDYLLAEAFSRDTGVRKGGSVLEIGCGLGLAGLVALGAGMEVCFSDYDEAPFDFIAKSIVASGFEDLPYSFARVDWRRPSEHRFDLVLGADVLYERQMAEQIARFLLSALEPGGRAFWRHLRTPRPKGSRRRGCVMASSGSPNRSKRCRKRENPREGFCGASSASNRRIRIAPQTLFERSDPINERKSVTPASTSRSGSS